MYENLVIISLTSIKIRYNEKILHSTLDVLTNLNYDNYTVVLNISKEPKYIDTGFTDDDIKCLSELYPKITINVVENYGPLRKIIPTLKLFNNNIIITVDDDCIYDKNIISTFVNIYMLHKCIVASRCRENFMSVSNTVINYSMINKDELRLDLLPEGVGGILYHSSMFDSKFININLNNIEDEFLKNDDLFIRAYTINKNIPVYCKIIPYKDKAPKYGLYNTFNINYIINFHKFINKIKFILESDSELPLPQSIESRKYITSSRSSRSKNTLPLVHVRLSRAPIINRLTMPFMNRIRLQIPASSQMGIPVLRNSLYRAIKLKY